MVKIVHLGLGPLGQKVVNYALAREGFQIISAVDIDPTLAGKDVGQLCSGKAIGVTIRSTLDEALEAGMPDVAVVTTVSSLAKLESQIQSLAEAHLPIVSTCEELSFPFSTQPELATRIDSMCKKHGVPCLGTGVNPGYLMDFLPTVLTGVCQKVDAVRVERIQDASVRRIPFQKKIGAGLTLDEFRQKEKEGTLRHVGLPESVDFIAHRIRWSLDRRTESLEPVVAETDVSTGYAPIAKGMARGVQQIGRGFVGDREVITLTFRAAVGEPESYDRTIIEGEPPLQWTAAGGVNGDIATCAITLNAIRSVLNAAPGLVTMCDVTPVGYFPGTR